MGSLATTVSGFMLSSHPSTKLGSFLQLKHRTCINARFAALATLAGLRPHLFACLDYDGLNHMGAHVAVNRTQRFCLLYYFCVCHFSSFLTRKMTYRQPDGVPSINVTNFFAIFPDGLWPQH